MIKAAHVSARRREDEGKVDIESRPRSIVYLVSRIFQPERELSVPDRSGCPQTWSAPPIHVTGLTTMSL